MKSDLKFLILLSILFIPGCKKDNSEQIDRNTCEVILYEGGNLSKGTMYCKEYFNKYGYLTSTVFDDYTARCSYDNYSNLIQISTPFKSYFFDYENGLMTKFQVKNSFETILDQRFSFNYSSGVLVDAHYYENDELKENVSFFCNNGLVDSIIFSYPYIRDGVDLGKGFKNIYVFNTSSDKKNVSLYLYSLADSVGSIRTFRHSYCLQFNDGNQLASFEMKDPLYCRKTIYSYNSEGLLAKELYLNRSYFMDDNQYILGEQLDFHYGELDSKTIKRPSLLFYDVIASNEEYFYVSYAPNVGKNSKFRNLNQLGLFY